MGVEGPEGRREEVRVVGVTGSASSDGREVEAGGWIEEALPAVNCEASPWPWPNTRLSSTSAFCGKEQGEGKEEARSLASVVVLVPCRCWCQRQFIGYLISGCGSRPIDY
jgi:hypothetical protein